MLINCIINQILKVINNLFFQGRKLPIRVSVNEPSTVTVEAGRSVRFVCSAIGSRDVRKLSCVVLFWANLKLHKTEFVQERVL